MRSYAKGKYAVKNIEKYVGKGSPTYRSSWELHVFRQLDESAAVVQWASEAVEIKYRHPFTGQVTRYYPDLLVVYIDQNNKKHAEVIEIKPLAQSAMTEAKSKNDKIQAAINKCKWAAAAAFCQAHGMKFRVMTEANIFVKNRKK